MRKVDTTIYISNNEKEFLREQDCLAEDLRIELDKFVDENYFVEMSHMDLAKLLFEKRKDIYAMLVNAGVC